MSRAINTAFVNIDNEHPDYEFVQALKKSASVFAAFKAHRQQNDIAALLLDDNNELRSFSDFVQACKPITEDYNLNWLKTEYDTAVIRARMAARMREFMRDADLYPNLKWLESTSAVKREAHIKLYGLILPITHPFWTRIFPGNLWNCKCGITNTDEEPNGDKYAIDDYTDDIPGGLEGNPAITGQLFGKKHPYRAKPYRGAARAVKNFIK